MKKNLLTKAIILALCGTTLSVSADDNTHLSPVTVISNYDNGAINSDTIDAEQLDKSLADNPRDLLRHQTNVGFEKQSVGGLGDIRIRGMGGMGSGQGTGQNRIAINVDGVPLPDVFKYGHITRNSRTSFDTADLKQVNITKGANGATGGNNGLAGTVNFTTKDPIDYLQDGKSFGGNIRIGYSGQDSGKSVGATVAGKVNDNFSAMLSYTYRNYHETENYDGVDTIGRKRTARDPADASSNNILTKFVFSPNDNHEFKLKLENYRMNYDTKLLSSSRASTDNYFDKSKNKRTTVSLRHNFDINAGIFDNGYWQAYYQKNQQNRTNDVAYGMSTGKTKYDVKDMGAELVLDKQLGNNDISYGLRLRSTKTAVGWFWKDAPMLGTKPDYQFQPDSRTKIMSAFINDDISLANGRLHVQPGIELVHYTISPEAVNGYKGSVTKVSKTKFNWKLGTTFDFNDNHQLFASYRQGLRLPSFAEQNSKGFHSTFLPNPELKPESGNSFEIGLRSQGDWGSQTISAFHDTYKDMIDRRKIGKGRPSKYQKYNLSDDIVLYGIEYQGALDMSALGLLEGLKLKGGLAYTKGKNKNTDQPYSNVDPLNGHVGIAYDSPSKNWGVELTTHFSAEKKQKDIAEKDGYKSISGYGVSDLTAYYKPIKNLHINAGIYNLFDKRYATWSEAMLNTGYSGLNYTQATEPGRTFAANLRYDF